MLAEEDIGYFSSTQRHSDFRLTEPQTKFDLLTGFTEDSSTNREWTWGVDNFTSVSEGDQGLGRS